MENKNILISGAGIAGTTLAFWLKKFGFNATLIEHAPKLREGGYAVDFWGAGFEVAERMGIVPALRKADLKISEAAFVDENNVRQSGLNYGKLKKLMNNQAFTLFRSDLSRIIYEQLDKDVEIIFGDSVAAIEQGADKVTVTFASGSVRNFDLVIGADGLHSKVRKLVFGSESQFEKFYGYYTSSYTIAEEEEHSTTFNMYNVPNKQAAVYANSSNKKVVFFIFTSDKKLEIDYHNIAAQKEIIRNQFKDAGWRCGELVAKIDTAPDFYFDVVSQIHMPQWWNGRVGLVGDAAYCPSLLSGQGSTLAMVGAYILAGELKEANGNYTTAFQRYQQIFKPFIDEKQKVAQGFAKTFVAKSKMGIWMRNIGINLMVIPLFAKMFIKKFMYDSLKLKNY